MHLVVFMAIIPVLVRTSQLLRRREQSKAVMSAICSARSIHHGESVSLKTSTSNNPPTANRPDLIEMPVVSANFCMPWISVNLSLNGFISPETPSMVLIMFCSPEMTPESEGAETEHGPWVNVQ